MTASTPPAGRPEPASSFVGRDSDLSRVLRLLAPSGALVTVVGAPGIGKTRLASEALSQSACADRFQALLADAKNAHDVEDAIVRATHTQLEPDAGPPLAQVAENLAEMGEALLLLDNAEQVLEVVLAAIEVLRSAAPQTRFLVTSRERLQGRGEWVFELAPLDVPAEGQDPLSSDAVRLLVDRVTQAAGRAMSDNELPHLAEIARRLEGIPLALELFSPSIALLGAEPVADRLRLEGQIHLQGPRSLAERQRTLYRAIESSWEQLTSKEQDALARLSTFSGGFTIDAALAVLPPELGSSALELLQRLRERSLIRVIDERPQRFAVFQSVREVARELATTQGEVPELALARHLADEVVRALRAPTGNARRRLLSEHENLRHVVGWAIQNPHQEGRELAAQVLLGLELLIDRVPLEKMLSDITAFLDAAEAQLSPAKRVGLQLAAARCKRRLGLKQAALEAQEQALEIAKGAALEPWIARATSELGMAHFVDGRLDQALRHWVVSTALYEQQQDDARVLVDELRTAMAQRESGSLLLAMGTAERAYIRSRRLRETELGALILAELAQLRLEYGDDKRASALLDEAERMPERSLLADAAIVARRGFIEIERGNGELAKQRLQRALFLFHRIGYRRFEGGAVGYLGVAELELGRLSRARDYLEQACDLMRDHIVACGLFSAWLAVVEQRSGNDARARLLAQDVPPIDRELAYSVAAHLLLSSVDAASPDTHLATLRLAGADATALLASHDVRIALRVIGTPLGPTEASDTNGLIVQADGSRFFLEGEHASIAKHAAMRRILIGLADQRLSLNGQSLTVEAMAQIGWPGERIREDAAKNRVKVAVAGLRKAGLKDALIHDGTGYALRPDLPLEVRAALGQTRD